MYSPKRLRMLIERLNSVNTKYFYVMLISYVFKKFLNYMLISDALYTFRNVFSNIIKKLNQPFVIIELNCSTILLMLWSKQKY